ncbi:MAG: FtsQ-type POTRA domain-containing protein [Chloroflexi bacterium]|nr:FtsQ-type POTRA domain-containing protein [Chloroflexota bacterium]
MNRRTPTPASRSDLVRQRRRSQSTQRLAQTAQRASRPVARQSMVRPASPAGKGSHRRPSDVAFSVGATHVRAPAISLPRFGPRAVSGLLALLLGFALYTLWNSATFTIAGAELNGALRIGTAEIDTALGVVGSPIFAAIPAEIEQALLEDYPELASVEVRVAFPNRIIVSVVERTPLIAWSMDAETLWIDSYGISFKERGQTEGLVVVSAGGTPPQAPVDLAGADAVPPFMAPAMVQTVLSLSGHVPPGTVMVYDPVYGLGWQDGRGWLVFFGENTEDINMKLLVYEAIVGQLIREGLQPALISVEYLEAPYYRLH